MFWMIGFFLTALPHSTGEGTDIHFNVRAIHKLNDCGVKFSSNSSKMASEKHLLPILLYLKQRSQETQGQLCEHPQLMSILS